MKNYLNNLVYYKNIYIYIFKLRFFCRENRQFFEKITKNTIHFDGDGPKLKEAASAPIELLLYLKYQSI